MVARKGDKTPPPPGGRAAERLREFEQARGLRSPEARSGTSGSETSDHDTSGDAEKSRRAEPKPPKP